MPARQWKTQQDHNWPHHRKIGVMDKNDDRTGDKRQKNNGSIFTRPPAPPFPFSTPLNWYSAKRAGVNGLVQTRSWLICGSCMTLEQKSIRKHMNRYIHIYTYIYIYRERESQTIYLFIYENFTGFSQDCPSTVPASA